MIFWIWGILIVAVWFGVFLLIDLIDTHAEGDTL